MDIILILLKEKNSTVLLNVKFMVNTGMLHLWLVLVI